MDSFFGIGLPELIVILILAGIVMGPERIRQVARWLGLVTAKMQAVSRTFMRQLNAELDTMEGSEDIRGAMQDVQDLRRQVEELRRELIGVGREPVDQSRRLLRESERALSQSIAPPGLIATSEAPPAADGQQAADGAAAADSAVPMTLPKLLNVPEDAE